MCGISCWCCMQLMKQDKAKYESNAREMTRK